MSKSLGNGVDPMDVIDQVWCGFLALLLINRQLTRTGSSLLATEKVEATWNFANKIWNASRFALMNMDGMTYEEIDLTGEKSVADKWILTRLNETIEQRDKTS